MCAIRRKVDDLGRVILPLEMRNTLKFEQNQPVEIAIRRDEIILRKTSSGCDLCGTEENLSPRGKYLLCQNCISEISYK